MSRGLSLDLRARAVALIAGGMSRRAAARHLMFAESSAIKWFKRFKETGSYAEKPGKKTRYSPLDEHADWLLALVKSEPDLTLAQIVVRLLDGRGVKTSDSSLCRFFQRRDITFKKKLCTPASSFARTWPRHAPNGRRPSRDLTPPSWSSSTKPAPTPR